MFFRADCNQFAVETEFKALNKNKIKLEFNQLPQRSELKWSTVLSFGFASITELTHFRCFCYTLWSARTHVRANSLVWPLLFIDLIVRSPLSRCCTGECVVQCNAFAIAVSTLHFIVFNCALEYCNYFSVAIRNNIKHQVRTTFNMHIIIASIQYCNLCYYNIMLWTCYKNRRPIKWNRFA